MVTEQDKEEPRLLAKDVAAMTREELQAEIEKLRGIRSTSPARRSGKRGGASAKTAKPPFLGPNTDFS